MYLAKGKLDVGILAMGGEKKARLCMPRSLIFSMGVWEDGTGGFCRVCRETVSLEDIQWSGLKPHKRTNCMIYLEGISHSQRWWMMMG